MTKGYFFTAHTRWDGLPLPEIGVAEQYKRLAFGYHSGFHVSRQPLDALATGYGPVIHFVECSDILREREHDLWCNVRTVISSMDITDKIHGFARQCALSVSHLWDCPEIVVRYFKTGDEKIRSAASDSIYKTGKLIRENNNFPNVPGVAWSAAKYAIQKDLTPCETHKGRLAVGAPLYAVKSIATHTSLISRSDDKEERKWWDVYSDVWKREWKEKNRLFCVMLSETGKQ